jgi:hypothetical protein
VGQEEVTGENADGISPDPPRRGPAPSLLPIIDDVIVQEGRQVNELCRDRYTASTHRRRTEARGRQKHHQRSYSLAPSVEQVSCGFHGGGDAVACEPLKFSIYGGEVVTEHVSDLGELVLRAVRRIRCLTQTAGEYRAVPGTGLRILGRMLFDRGRHLAL